MRERKLGRTKDARKMLLRNLVTSLILHGRLTTTEAKAKAIKPLADRMVTLGKRADLHARRQAAAFLLDPVAVQKLFAEVAPRYKERNGGYTRVLRVGMRQGDAAPVALIEWV
ncbi:MAG: 50S ribosomal protein L17 [Limnochordaceae bacterium]|nr:50S ribosomal protein L17 [Limnochordaceae bacterium]